MTHCTPLLASRAMSQRARALGHRRIPEAPHNVQSSVTLLDGRAAGAARGAARAAHATHVRHATATGRLVHLHHDRVDDTLELLLLRFELLRLGHLVALELLLLRFELL